MTNTHHTDNCDVNETTAGTNASPPNVDPVACPVCHGPAGTVPATSTNLAACGLPGWTADCQSSCDDAPRVTRFTRDDAAKAWNELVDQVVQSRLDEEEEEGDDAQGAAVAMNQSLIRGYQRNGL
jgi:hypothetical protein